MIRRQQARRESDLTAVKQQNLTLREGWSRLKLALNSATQKSRSPRAPRKTQSSQPAASDELWVQSLGLES